MNRGNTYNLNSEALRKKKRNGEEIMTEILIYKNFRTKGCEFPD